MTMIAYAYLQSRRLAEASGGKRIRQGPPKPTPPAIRRAVLAILAPRRPIDVLIAGEPSEDASNKSAKVELARVTTQSPLLCRVDRFGRKARLHVPLGKGGSPGHNRRSMAGAKTSRPELGESIFESDARS